MIGSAPVPFPAASRSPRASHGLRRLPSPVAAGMGGVVAMMICLIAAGCGCKPRTTIQPLTVRMQREPALNDSLIRVALFAARDAELEDWQARPASELTRDTAPDEYKPDRKVVYFTADGENQREVLSADDAIWRQWATRGGWNLVAVADVAGGDEPAKRQVFTVDACDWRKQPMKEVRLRVSPTGLSIIEPHGLSVSKPR